MNMRDLDPREEGRARPEPNDELQKIQIGAVLEKFTFIRQELSKDMKGELTDLVRRNVDLFAWALEDMIRIDLRVICHKLAIDPKVRLVLQKKRKLGVEKQKVAMQETAKLLKVGFIKEIHFTTWLANAVMVPKSSEKRRMCLDFTDLNKACPKDAYPLPS